MLLALPGFENLSIIKRACAQILHAKICGVVIHTHQEHEQDGLPQENWWTKHEPPIEHHLVHWPKCSWLSEKWVWRSSIAPRDSGCMAIWKGQNHRSGQILQQLAQDERERVRDLGGYPTVMGGWLVMAFLTASRTSGTAAILTEHSSQLYLQGWRHLTVREGRGSSWGQWLRSWGS